MLAELDCELVAPGDTQGVVVFPDKLVTFTR